MELPGNDHRNAPILLFDSGIGGLSVLKEIKRLLPLAPIVYVADYAGLPYGTKDEQEIALRVPAILGRAVERYQPRLVVIACNTACTIALSHVRSALQLPVVGTVPAIKPAALASRSGVIGLLGTQATIRQPYVDKLEAEFARDIKLLRFAAPELVHAAEAKMRGEFVDPAVFESAMSGLLQQPSGVDLDVVILGCTHFPLVRDELMENAHEMKFVDGAHGIALHVAGLSEGQGWPLAPIPGQFVTTGIVDEVKPYSFELAKFDLIEIKELPSPRF